MKKSILMICYYFPPIVDVGCKRSVAFSKYLKKHGWNPHVISVKNPDKKYCLIGKDEPPKNISIDYTYSIINPYTFLGKLNGLLYRFLKFFRVELKRNYFNNIFCIPDIFFGWIPLTLVRSYKIIKEKGTVITPRENKRANALRLINRIRARVMTLKHGYIADKEFDELVELVKKMR